MISLSDDKQADRFPYIIDFPKCRREIAASLIDFSNRCCKRFNMLNLMP